MQWEYAVETIPGGGVIFTGDVNSPSVAHRLNQFGAMGWELVSSYTTSYAEGGTHLLVFIYKRPRVEVPPIPAAAGTAGNPLR